MSIPRPVGSPPPISLRSIACRFALAGIAACAHSPRLESPSTIEATLRAQTQDMLDAIAVGHAAVWDRYLDPRVVYVSESGAIESRDSLLAQLKPLPDGVTGSISIPSFKVNVFGDTAVTVYVASETENYFGHPLTAEYLTSDTWRRGPQGWRLVASHVYVKPFDPPAIALPAEQLDDYVGSYRLTPEISYTVRRDGAELTGERTGKPPQPLSVEARDVLFVAGQPRSRKIVLRDPAGRVTGFADRREGHDIVWQRSTMIE